jgi:hypothetical protein
MAIDARVQSVIHNEDESGELRLVDRPARPGGFPGICGQSALFYEKAPYTVTSLNGLDVWGGNATLMLGDRKIADREGYSRIEFVPDDEFTRACIEYRRRGVSR